MGQRSQKWQRKALNKAVWMAVCVKRTVLYFLRFIFYIFMAFLLLWGCTERKGFGFYRGADSENANDWQRNHDKSCYPHRPRKWNAFHVQQLIEDNRPYDTPQRWPCKCKTSSQPSVALEISRRLGWQWSTFLSQAKFLGLRKNPSMPCKERHKDGN